MDRLKIDEIIVCEGRDDTANILRAVDCLTIETHGFGIKKETWEALETGYRVRGLIILTDPDFSGNEIRRRISEKFPLAKQAYISKADATKDGDIGVENAEPNVIREAILNARILKSDSFFEKIKKEDINGDRGENLESTASPFIFNMDVMIKFRLAADSEAKARREKLGRELGIGYVNAKTFIKKLNGFGIREEEFNEALSAIDG